MTSEYTRLKLYEKKMTSVNYRLLWNDFVFRYLTQVSTRPVTHPLRLRATRSYLSFSLVTESIPFPHWKKGLELWGACVNFLKLLLLFFCTVYYSVGINPAISQHLAAIIL